MAPAEVVDPLIYDGFVEELVEVLEIKDNEIMVSQEDLSVLHTITCIVYEYNAYSVVHVVCTIHAVLCTVQDLYCRYMHAISLATRIYIVLCYVGH